MRSPSLRPARVPLLGAALCMLAAAHAGAQNESAAPRSVAGTVVRHAGLEGRVLWLDATANLERLSSREGVADVMERCRRANINTVVVDVKPLSGHVLFESRHAPRLKEWRGFQVPAGFDLLRTAVSEGRRRGLKVHASINVFSDGHKLVRQGPIYEKPAQQSIIYDIERTMTTPRGERKTVSIGVNRNPEPGQIAVFDGGYRQRRLFSAGEAFAVVIGNRVEVVADGLLAPADGVPVPENGYLLVGRGDGARWILLRLLPGDVLAWTAVDRLIPVVDAPSEPIAAFANPSNPATRDYEQRVLEELLAQYDLDGVVFDRMRYASLQSDFSELSRQQFEAHLGVKLNRWPGDVYAFDPVPGRPLQYGPYWKQWLEWRAANIRSWLEKAAQTVRARRPGAMVGVYVGSWYPTYYTVGVNWASTDFVPGYDWMSPTYPQTGYAGLVDWITTGCYHSIASREQARTAGLDESYTVEAAAQLSSRVVADSTFVYAGLYLLDYRGSPDAFREAIRAARTHSHGVMLFDLSHLESYGWWGVLEEEFRTPQSAPHDVPELLQAVRAVGRAVRMVTVPGD